MLGGFAWRAAEHETGHVGPPARLRRAEDAVRAVPRPSEDVEDGLLVSPLTWAAFETEAVMDPVILASDDQDDTLRTR